MNKLQRMYHKRKPLIVFALAFIALMLIAEVILHFYSLERVFEQAPGVARAAFFAIIVVEVIIAPIPGGLIGYLGAVHFGFWHTWAILYTANVVGTIIVFFLARKLGRRFLEQSTTADERARYDALLHKNPWVLYAVYAIPVLPIDVISILAGVSQIPAKRFIPIAVAGLITYTGIIAALGAFFGDFIPFVENLTIAAAGIIIFGTAYVLWKWKKKEKH